MKAKLTYVFELPEEQSDLDMINRAAKVECALHEFSSWLRAQVKYGSDDKLHTETLEAVRERFYEFMSGSGAEI